MADSHPIRLTQTVKKGGCAAKVAAEELRKILAGVEFPPSHPELLVHSGTFDDAAIYKVNDELALVQTLDFFTPIVDSPKQFGRIASANALSDVYAMGGKPVTAMAIFAFPLATMDNAIAVAVLQGASDTIKEAGAVLAGGHTIDDDTMKFGLSVTGYVHPQRVWSNAGARPGDVLILTKPLGTGTLTAALKQGQTTEDQIADGLESMCTLNDVPGCLSKSFADKTLHQFVHSATDVTGFGLGGHAFNLAKASQVSLEFEFAQLPRFEKTLEFLSKGFLTKAHRTNREYVGSAIHFDREDALMHQLVFDPQTNGGLLLAVAPEASNDVLAALKSKFVSARIVGSVQPRSDYLLKFK